MGKFLPQKNAEFTKNKKFLMMKISFLMLILCCPICWAQLSVEPDKIAQKLLAECRKKSSNRVAFEAKVKAANGILSKLSDQDLRSVYEKLRAMLNNDDDDPFSGQEVDSGIGLILANTQDKNLISDILAEAPPKSVGFQSLTQYLEGLSKEILIEVIVKSASKGISGK